MPLSKAHKDQSRRKIIDAAGELFRRHGYDGVGIDTIMAKAGLTRGGFYAHFASKAALFADVLAVEPAFNRMLAQRPGETRGELMDSALEVLGNYLDPARVPHVASTCPMVSLSRDVDKAGHAGRAALTHVVEDLAGQLKRGMTGAAQDPRTLAVLALCIGGVTIARTADTPATAKAVLDACRREAVRLLGAKPRAKARKARVRH
ncbi:MAG: TetR/AcrR family transcriptional regulator [Rhodospirillaceae bacterium]|nr:TetR/AcrR family transcriptional regulator [Rhodospirillaceae bacterium]